MKISLDKIVFLLWREASWLSILVTLLSLHVSEISIVAQDPHHLPQGMLTTGKVVALFSD